MCSVCNLTKKQKFLHIKEDVDSYKEKVSTLEKQLENKQNEESREYDCSFTRTYRVIDSIDYPLASDGLSYIVVDDYQGYVPFVVAIPSSIDNLETYKYYEFTYHLKGKGLINNFEQLNSYLISSLFNKYHGNSSSGTVYVELDIVETSKKGVEQIQEKHM
ncbi:MAG: hypothetical protein L6V91_07950 [Bacilli bacterium]|nr:MAG: hypothetical protein L6V91_07950 [Bacilli bacterium]